ncbi:MULTISPECIES: DUF4823 domain-containing protein [unclassified Pseudomonas]|uniref:DUF4823 domain-containing protein n=1 Tax=Pseudomonas TaxID=286 RepID=UPI00200D0884|nr:MULTISPECIES: DUF4823 domain-containing protein [unclassified Pseudomonas]
MFKRSIIVLSVLMSGCSAKYVQQDLTTSPEKLIQGQSVSIATPVDGRYETTVYKASGAMTADAVRSAFARYANQVKVSESCADLACIRQQGNAGYYVVPEILHWEDRATEWSGIPDRIEVKLAIYGAKGDEPLASTVVSGKSKWLTFGGDHPQDLLQKPIESYVKAQY